MTIAFTICSINYLAQARTLGDSLKSTNPEIKFIIGLVDSVKNVVFDESYTPEFPMIEIDKIDIKDFQEMAGRYNITELNTAVKPFYFTYFFKQYSEAENVIYFDPDIIVFQPLSGLLNSLAEHKAVLTPHINSPIEDRLVPNELHHLNTGIYNLGFAAFRRSEETTEFVHWWEEKLRYECLIDLCNGLFVDQNWMNFLPVFMPETHIERNPGYNAAYWNLHERTFSVKNDTIFVNETNPLIFFHYSGYDPEKPDVLSKYQNRFELKQRPDLTILFDLYRNKLLENGNAYYRKFPCSYIRPVQIRRYQRIRKWLKMPLQYLIDQLATT
ncbi:glycosyl transferase [Dyadobacter flavalbus]|uniref:Glycosyl transferase n=1 Tax=Dyadobacter flavalbus TaxID=2579942 RepID=A0A5M8QU98_9BACT|nr:glycosyl transferase [Dyadobacter flavalbus]KAA6439729.1 glycosyl transferase [Dyadobacter flavalbus]